MLRYIFFFKEDVLIDNPGAEFLGQVLQRGDSYLLFILYETSETRTFCNA